MPPDHEVGKAPLSLTRKLGPYGVGALLSDPVKRLRRGVAEAKRRVMRAPHRIHYFHHLRGVVEGLGVVWAEALPHLWEEEWREELEHSRKTLFALGLWGVPSFRLLGPVGTPEYVTWGQDRIWRVEQEIVRRLA